MLTLTGAGQPQNGGGLQPTFELKYDLITTDFTFTRNSFATRVNEFGLIETVTDLGSDLVQNGSFDELGSELVVNGNFDDVENDLNFAGDWTLVDGTAEILTSTQSYLRSDNDRVPLTVKTYKLQYEVVTTNGSNMRVAGGSSAFGTVTLDSATVGVKTAYLTSNGTQAYLQINQNSFRGSIDNISLKQVDPNDYWVQIGTGITITDKANFDGSGATVNFRQVGVITTTNTYKVTYTISDYSQGNLKIRLGGTYGAARTVNGTYTEILTATNFNFQIYGFSNFIGSIDNVSVQEVLEDDVPRIDYTGSTFDVPVYGDELLTDGVISNVNGGIMTFTANGVNSVSDGTTGSTLRPRLLWSSLTVGKQYRIIGTPTVNSGSTTYSVYDGSSYLKNNVATESFDITFTCNGSSVFFANDGTQTFDIDWDLSIKELTAYTTTDKGAFLLEPISTNLSNHSGFDSGSGWTRLGSTGAYVSGLAPDGDTSVFELTSVTQGKLQKGISGLSINTQYTLSFYVKQTSATNLVQSRVLSLTGGSGGSNLIGVNYQDQLVNKEWVRITHTFTTNDTLGDYIVYVSNGLTVGKSLQFFGAQVEESSYATSYIPTNGTTVTRAQETCVDATPTINSEEGVLYGELSVPSVDNFVLIALGNSSANNDQNSVTIGFDNGVDFYGRVKSPSGSFTSSNVNAPINTNYKIALRYEQNNCALFVDGVKIASSLTNYLFALPLDNLSFNYNTNNGLPFYGRTKDLRIYDKALTDTQLIELTTI